MDLPARPARSDGAPPPRAAASPSSARRTALELTADQLAGIAASTSAHRAAAEAEAAAASGDQTREVRRDVARRLEVRRREQAALLQRAARHLEQTARLLPSRSTRAVLVHRDAALRDAVAARLAEQGVEVVARLGDGADAAGVVAVEQPEVLLVEDRLPSLSGLQVLQRARRFAPRTLVAAHLQGTAELDDFLEAGAEAVFTRRLPAQRIADGIVECWTDRRDLALLL